MKPVKLLLPFVFFILFTLPFCRNAPKFEKKLMDSLNHDMVEKGGYYDIHITKCKADPTLFVVGLEWGAARQLVSVLKYNNNGTVLWETKFADNELPGYIISVKQISLKGFLNPLIEIVAGERGICEYYLFELEGSKLTDRTKAGAIVFYDHDMDDEPDRKFLDLSKITYSDRNKDGYDDITITGFYEFHNKKSAARKVLVYNPKLKQFEEDLELRRSIINSLGNWEEHINSLKRPGK